MITTNYYSIYMNNEDLALNNVQLLIHHKNKGNNLRKLQVQYYQ